MRWLLVATMMVSCSSAKDPDPVTTPTTPTASTPSMPADPAPPGGVEAAPPEVWVSLFDGALTPAWKMSTITNQPGRDDPGHFTVEDGALVAHPGTDLGLLWNDVPTPASYVLELEWRLSAADDNSGVFLRFPDLASKGYDNTAWVAIDYGFEIQINEPGVPDGAPMHTTGAVYSQADQTFTRVVAHPPGQWNLYSIRVENQSYTVTLNGTQVTHFENGNPARGVASPAFIGFQTHTGNVAFRNVRIRSL